ncbi:DNA mismatch repair protein MutS [Paenibacillus sp. alder61]|uniref:DNA mismatch repair protein MutS n=1 Tax=Paenibacillus faecis TaxID=862114 RepID=A0A5D0CP51_9BACL|nr:MULTISPECIES: DNA mismatch repair protein MutS [Paenibacillus]MCA1292607.1 DNA mismatch repair protein MutS [Paenibacillus sp. alder61]TYA11651.1 DNA mismatch repair protein MutS [Paenibacillus faecis]
MENFTLNMLEYESMKQDLSAFAVSYEGRARIARLVPMEELRPIERAIAETAEARELIGRGSSVPLPSLEGIELVASLLGTGYLFTEQDLTAVQTFLQSCGQLKKYIESKGDAAWQIGIYAASLRDLPELRQEIMRCIRHGVITNEASRDLEKIRRKIDMLKEKINKKMHSVMSRHAAILQESIVSVRGGRYVIPVKKEFYRQVKGRMLDQSTSGQTVFIEPDEISSLQGELELLQGEEAREEAKILGYLTELVEKEAASITGNIEITGLYDFIFAKAKYAASMDAAAVGVNDKGRTVLRGAKHPKLLGSMVPLDLEIGADYKTLIITGPNTGGKTVVLKTFGLLSLMVQSGLLVPVGPGSEFAVYRGIMAVIGDGQNLEQSLSTFSAQIQSLVAMLKVAGPSTLLLIDELAAGTDPGEGIALSIAILEEFSRKKATVLVTTHFNELKTFASRAEGFENARMEFDPDTLRPLYKLTIGRAGQSYAIEIARKLGITADIIARSQHIVSRQIGAGGKVSVWDEIVPARNDSPADSIAGQLPQPQTQTETASERISEARPEEDKQLEARALTEKERRWPEARGTSGHRVKTDTSGEEEREDEMKLAPHRFEIGDAVYVTALGKIGIVSEPEDLRGTVGVLIQKQRIKVNRKRLKPYLKKDQLYPEDYDLDIVLDTKENRKKRKLMSKQHVEGMEIVRRPDETY